MCVLINVCSALLFCGTFKRSSVPSAAACSCSSSPLLFLPLLLLLLLLLFHPRACASPPSLSLCLAPPGCHCGGGGCVGGGIPAPGSAGRGFLGESAPSRPRTRAGFLCSDKMSQTRKQGGDWPRGSRRQGGRWWRSSGSHAPPPGSCRRHRETARLDESGCPARSPPAGHLLPPGERERYYEWVLLAMRDFCQKKVTLAQSLQLSAVNVLEETAANCILDLSLWVVLETSHTVEV